LPTTYAHYKFGVQTAERLPADLQAVIYRNPEPFFIGVHGPDILFYYEPWHSTRVARLGSELHTQTGKVFFSRCGEVLTEHARKTGTQELPEADLSYLYGFLCHFALDRPCHAIIDDEALRAGSSHNEIEVELDRYLLTRDGFDAVSRIVTGHIHPSPENAAVIAKYFPGVSAKQLDTALRSSVTALNLLVSPGRVKRQILVSGLKALHLYEKHGSLLMQREAVPACAETVHKLLRLYDEALPEAVTLITDFTDCISGRKDWNPLMEYTFGGDKG
jgi:hypothetical protein